MGRIHAVVRRIVQCLYLYETGLKLPTVTHEARVVSIEMLQEFEPAERAEFQKRFIEPLARQDLKLVASNQFGYSVIHTGRPYVSAWTLLFYGSLPFVRFPTGRKQPTLGKANS